MKKDYEKKNKFYKQKKNNKDKIQRLSLLTQMWNFDGNQINLVKIFNEE